MIKSKDYKFFLFTGPTNIKFEAIDVNNEVYFSKKNLIDNSSSIENLDILEKFLKNHIFDIEKNLNNYVKDINLVVDHNDFLFVNLSMKYNFDGIKFNLNRLNSLLVELKSQFKNTIGNFEVIHMVINKFIVDGKMYSQLTEITNYDKICLEIKFICLNRSIVKNLKDILSKYQIMVRNIICYAYLKEFKDFSDRKSSIIAHKVLNGLNQNEIFFSNKSTKNISFFEKFFSFFN
tara:strand:+ start:2271 stop:2972 length:702 start_codon:yes stop_codon:yes gene_type:complete